MTCVHCHGPSCYLMAGFEFAGRTKKDDLLALQLPATKAIDIWVQFYQGG